MNRLFRRSVAASVAVGGLAVFSSVASAPARVFGASAGALATWLGWPLFFLSTVFMALPGIGIAFFLKKELTEVPLLEEPT